MSTTVNGTYGSYIPANPSYINSYGVTITQYGVIGGTTIPSLLMETGSYILQESGGKIGLE
jgi:hypothetical protein